MNRFEIGYNVNPTLHVNKDFRDQFKKLLKESFHSSTFSGIKNVMKKWDVCVIVIVLFYYNRTTNPMKRFRVLSCVVYSAIEKCLH